MRVHCNSNINYTYDSGECSGLRCTPVDEEVTLRSSANDRPCLPLQEGGGVLDEEGYRVG